MRNNWSVHCETFSDTFVAIHTLSPSHVLYHVAGRTPETRRVGFLQQRSESVKAAPLFPHPDELSQSVSGFGVFAGYNSNAQTAAVTGVLKEGWEEQPTTAGKWKP